MPYEEIAKLIRLLRSLTDLLDYRSGLPERTGTPGGDKQRSEDTAYAWLRRDDVIETLNANMSTGIVLGSDPQAFREQIATFLNQHPETEIAA